MANPIWDILRGNYGRYDDQPMDVVPYLHRNSILEEEQGYMRQQIVDLEEDLLRISDAFDRRGTLELTGMSEGDALEIPLATVKRIARTSRATMAMNPFVKRGVEARIGYIWGKGVSFDEIDGIKSYLDDNRRVLFSPQALNERERALATDGNVFLAHPNQKKYTADDSTSFRITLEEITGSISNPDNREEVWYYKRNWVSRVMNASTNRINTKNNVRYYPSMAYAQQLEKQDKNLPAKWGNVQVDQDYVIQHIAVNKQVGWRWGVPDILPVIFWAKAYKEYLEDNATLVKAYSRLAWQVKVPNGQMGAGIAGQILQSGRFGAGIRAGQDDLGDIGGSMVAGGGVEMAPLATNASSIDFSKGAPLASAIAAGLEVSQTVLTSTSAGASGSYGAEQTLDLPTLKAMELRQQLHEETFLELFSFWGAPDSIVTWPQIYSDSTKDRIAAVGTAIELGSIFPEEGRKAILDTLDIAPIAPWDELPDPADDPKNIYKEQLADKAFEQAQQTANAVNQTQNTVTNGQNKAVAPGKTGAPAQTGGTVVAAQGKSGGISAKGGAQTSSNSARANRKADTKTK